MKYRNTDELIDQLNEPDEEMEEQINEILSKKIDPHTRIWKMCDNCEIVYPEHYVFCIKCGSYKLRVFQIHNNMKQLFPSWN